MKNNTNLVWTTETRKVSSLIPNTKNPRVMSPKQVEDLKKSLQKYNLVEIPVIDTKNRVIAGHQRLMVLKLLGREHEDIDVRVPNRELTQKEYDQYLISSNRIHGDWDWDLLRENFDFDLLIESGFESIELSNIFDKKDEVVDDNWNEQAELKKIKKTDIKIGDIYQLGKHKLICGDSTNPEVVKTLTNGVFVDMINQDPPFNINLDYNKGVGGKKSNKNYGGKVDDNKTDEDYMNFIEKMIKNSLSVAKKDCHIFYWTDERYVWLFQTLYKKLGVDSKRLCIWLKNNSSPTPKTAFNKVTEFCVYGTIGNPYLAKDVNNLNEIMNKEMTTGNQLAEQATEFINTWVVKRLASNEYEHPTQKSPSLHEKSIKRCTKIGDIVLDLTAGSGSIMVSCHQLNRIAYMCEMEPIFCQLIINRFNKISNEKAKKIN